MLIIAVVAIALLFLLYTFIMWFRKKNNRTFLELNACLDKRCDIAPQIVRIFRDCVKGENDVADAVIKARNKSATSLTIEEKLTADAELQSAIECLFNTAQNCNELASDSDFIELKNQFETLKNEADALIKTMNVKLLNGEKYDLN